MHFATERAAHRRVCLIAISVLAAAVSARAESILPALYVVENINTPGQGAVTCSLDRLTFSTDGALVNDTIGTVDQRFFSHFGGHRIVDNRYIVTKWGGVIDLESKEIINKFSLGELLAVDRGKVIYSVSNAKIESGYFAFDLQSRNVSKLDAPGRYAMPGAISPNQTMSVRQEFKRSGNMMGPGTVTLLETVSPTDGYLDVLPPAGLFASGSSRPTKELGNGDLKFESSDRNAIVPEVNKHPFLWLDDRNILTQRRNGELVILGIDGSLSELLEIPAAKGEPPRGPPRLWKDPDGRIVYSIGLSKDTGKERAGKKVFTFVSGDFIVASHPRQPRGTLVGPLVLASKSQ